MATLERMWINQPSTLDALHALHGTNVLAEREDETTMRIFFLSGDVVCQQASPLSLSSGWRPLTPATPEEVIEVVAGLHKALGRMIDAHNPDSREAEWLGHSNELHRKLTGMDVPFNRL
jgi:hypothetical protein